MSQEAAPSGAAFSFSDRGSHDEAVLHRSTPVGGKAAAESLKEQAARLTHGVDAFGLAPG
jgi:hypothetical protein